MHSLQPQVNVQTPPGFSQLTLFTDTHGTTPSVSPQGPMSPPKPHMPKKPGKSPNARSTPGLQDTAGRSVEGDAAAGQVAEGGSGGGEVGAPKVDIEVAAE